MAAVVRMCGTVHTYAKGEELVEGDGCRSGLDEALEPAGLGGNRSVVLLGLKELR